VIPQDRPGHPRRLVDSHLDVRLPVGVAASEMALIMLTHLRTADDVEAFAARRQPGCFPVFIVELVEYLFAARRERP